MAGGDFALNLRYLANSQALAHGFASGTLVRDPAVFQTLTLLETGLEKEREAGDDLLSLIAAYKEAQAFGRSREVEVLNPAIAELVRAQSEKLDRLLFQMNRSSAELTGVKRFAPSRQVVAAVRRELAVAAGGF